MVEDLQKKLQKELDQLTIAQKDYDKTIGLKQHHESQLNENKAVAEELALLSSDAEVYKLIGPVLVKQDLEEAKQNVAKRIEYISKEVKRNDDHLMGLDSKQESLRESLARLNASLNKMKVKP